MEDMREAHLHRPLCRKKKKNNLAELTSKTKEMVHSHISVIQQQVVEPYTCWNCGDMGPFSFSSPSPV